MKKNVEMNLDDLLTMCALAMDVRTNIPESANCFNCGNQFCREKGVSMANECKSNGFLYWEE